MSFRLHRLQMLCALYLVLVSGILSAQSTDIEVSAWVDPAAEIVVSQQLILNIEIATSSYFLGGTRLPQLEIPDAIVLRRESFAVNSTKRKDGQTWAVQLWSMTVYPQRAGRFEIPAIKVDATISGADGQPTQVSATSEAFEFDVIVAADAPMNKPWLATTKFDVEETFDRDFANLELGDSITRTITFRAEDLAAMMLPEVRFSPVEDGLAIYPAPPVLDDKVNRGDYLAQRTEMITYVVEKPGRFTLPAQSYYWFDLASRSYKVEELPEHVITTTLSLSYYVRSVVAAVWGFIAQRELFDWILLSVVLFGFYSARGRFKGLVRSYRQSKANRKALRVLESRFVAECRAENFAGAVKVLYLWFDLTSQSSLANVNSPDSMKLSTNGRYLSGRELADSRGVVRDFIESHKMGENAPSAVSLSQVFESLMAEAFNKTRHRSSSSDNATFKRFIKELAKLQSSERGSLLKLTPINLKLN